MLITKVKNQSSTRRDRASGRTTGGPGARLTRADAAGGHAVRRSERRTAPTRVAPGASGAGKHPGEAGGRRLERAGEADDGAASRKGRPRRRQGGRTKHKHRPRQGRSAMDRGPLGQAKARGSPRSRCTRPGARSRQDLHMRKATTATPGKRGRRERERERETGR